MDHPSATLLFHFALTVRTRLQPHTRLHIESGKCCIVRRRGGTGHVTIKWIKVQMCNGDQCEIPPPSVHQGCYRGKSLCGVLFAPSPSLINRSLKGWFKITEKYATNHQHNKRPPMFIKKLSNRMILLIRSRILIPFFKGNNRSILFTCFQNFMAQYAIMFIKIFNHAVDTAGSNRSIKFTRKLLLFCYLFVLRDARNAQKSFFFLSV